MSKGIKNKKALRIWQTTLQSDFVSKKAGTYREMTHIPQNGFLTKENADKWLDNARRHKDKLPFLAETLFIQSVEKKFPELEDYENLLSDFFFTGNTSVANLNLANTTGCELILKNGIYIKIGNKSDLNDIKYFLELYYHIIEKIRNRKRLTSPRQNKSYSPKKFDKHKIIAALYARSVEDLMEILRLRHLSTIKADKVILIQRILESCGIRGISAENMRKIASRMNKMRKL